MELGKKPSVITERDYFYLDINGARFSPEIAERRTGLALDCKLEKNTIRRDLSLHHPQYGKVAGFGAAILQAPNGDTVDQRRWIILAVRRWVTTFRKLGATHVALWHMRFCHKDSQENFELTVREITVLAKTRVPFCLSVYHPSRKEILGMPTRYWPTGGLKENDYLA